MRPLAVDCPTIFPFAQTVIIGFIGSNMATTISSITQLHSTAQPSQFLQQASASSLVVLAAFGYAYGGWRGALLGSFLVGILLTAGHSILYPPLLS